ncbi:MAG: hypothetical protein PHN69_03585 [Candidatus Pacebacteria bacterium]|nr:hypothetical protein [Candidatus Paceibacterota bacterium]
MGTVTLELHVYANTLKEAEERVRDRFCTGKILDIHINPEKMLDSDNK